MNIARHFRLDRAAIVATTIVVLDQLSKWWASSALEQGESVNVFFGVAFTATRNEGIAFGFFAGRPYLVLGLMVAALLVLLWFYGRHRDRGALWLATGLLLGGAIGNAIDRVSLGYVRDFIDTSLLPTFNVADIAITFGVVVLVLTAEQQHEVEGEASAESGEVDRVAD